MVFREMKAAETGLLQDFLYDAIFVPEGSEPPDRTIVAEPELILYHEGFGSEKADFCIVAEESGRIIGAVWTRIMNDYGHIDDETPSLAISLKREYRGKGIGTALMEKMLELLRQQGYKQVSLSVQKANPAVRMYERAGFRTVRENGGESIMVCALQIKKCGDAWENGI